MNLFQKIKQAFSCCPGNDNTSWPTGQCGYNGKTATFVRLLPYGLSSLEPENYFVFVMNSQGQESSKFGIPSAMQDRLKGLKQGEVAIYNSKTQTYVILLEDGTFKINCSGLIDGDVEITGDVQIDGNLNVDGNVTIGGTLGVTGATTMTTVTCTSITIGGIPFGTHVHSGVQSGGSNTGGPL